MATLLGDLALKSTAILLLAWFATLIMRRSSAAARHLVWTVALVGVVALPLFSLGLPSWSVPAVPKLTPPAMDLGFRAETVPIGVAPAVSEGPAESAPQRAPVAQADVPQAVVAEADAPGYGSEDAVVAPAAAPVRFQMSLAPGIWLPVVWFGGLAIVLAAIVSSLLRTVQLERRARPIGDGQLRRVFLETCRRLGVARPVRLVTSGSATMPMTWGVAWPVVLVPGEADAWLAPRMRAVLLHELAHVVRYDFVTQLVARLACALCWFNPMVWLAAHRMRVERELACDDLVLSAGSRASEYAQQLLDIARSFRAERLAAVATVAMARPSQLSGRLLAVLDPALNRRAVTRGAVTAAAVLATLVLAPVATASVWQREAPADEVPQADQAPVVHRPLAEAIPALSRAFSASPTSSAYQGAACDWDNGETNSASTSINNDRMRIRMELDPDCRLDVDASGEVQFSRDFTDVIGLDRRGSFEIEERVGRERRRLEIDENGGKLTRRWYVNGTEQASDAQAQQWLARMLTVMFRRTGYQAEKRADWILSQGGVPGLLQEIGYIRSDYTMGKYYGILLSQKQLDAAMVRSIVQDAGQRIHSDYALGQLLTAVAEHQPLDHNVQVAYVEASGHIDSDYEKSRVLSAILQRPDLSQDVADAMLRQSTTLGSDYELAKLLKGLIAAHPISASMTPVFFQAVGGIESDYERGAVLGALLDKGVPSLDVLDRTLESAEGISSDYELSKLLMKVADKYPLDRALPASYVKAARSIESDNAQGQVWGKLLAREQISPAALAAVLDAASGIDSDYEQSKLLRALLERHHLDDATRPAFFRAVGRIDSDHELGQVLGAALAAKPLPRATVMDVITATSNIDSDYELGRVLMGVADAIPLDDAIRSALRNASDRIESSYTRGQVLEKLYPRQRP